MQPLTLKPQPALRSAQVDPRVQRQGGHKQGEEQSASAALILARPLQRVV